MEDNELKDYFVTKNGVTFAGTHLIIDMWGVDRLDDIEYMEEILKECTDASKATLLHIHLHHFTPSMGVTGVAVLAESHISLHTWPECNFAAFDIFMCGNAEPHNAIPILEKMLSPEKMDIKEELRGIISNK